jgi:hypothetical protein
MFAENKAKRLRTDTADMSENGEIAAAATHVVRFQENKEHGMRILRGLAALKREKVLCDVTLIAEGMCNCTF